MLNRTLKIRLIFTLLAMVAVVAVAASRMPATVTASADSAMTSVIVQLRDEPAAVYKAKAARDGRAVSDDELQAYRDQLRAGQDQFLADLQSRGVAYTVRGTDVTGFDGSAAGRVDFRYTLVLNGLALSVPRASVPLIASMPQVKSVQADEVFHPLLDRAVNYVQAPRVYSNPPQVSQFPSLHSGGYHGEGVNIAVLDTGTDWSHDMFGGDPTPPRLGLAPPTPAATNSNQKVIYALPLVAVPPDGVQDDFGHGTHVAADAAGYRAWAPGTDGVPNTADDVTLHGVAPQARIMAYKVCYGIGSALANLGVPAPFIGGCNGSAIIMGMEDAVSPRTITGYAKPVANIINLSLGGAGGPDSSTALAADNAVLAGAIVVASAGNSGPGEGTVGSPAAGRRVIAVGANNDPGVLDNSIDVLEANRSGIKPGTPRMPAVFAPDSNATRPIQQPVIQNYVFSGLADTPDQVPLTVAGRICLAERGSTATVEDQGTGLFANKATNCAAKGGIALVVYNNVPGPIGAVLAPSTIPVFTISREDGLILRNDLGFDATGVSRFPIRINPASQGTFRPEMAGFSSRGPVQGFGQVKPDVTAPGVAILAATTPVGVPLGSMADPSRYTSAQGTSFSGPIVTGVVALVKQAHPNWNADMVRTALINTATNLRDGNGNPKPDGTGADAINDQGGGLVNAYGAVHARALMGVAGDGITSPTILGSHSYDEVPVINSRVTHTENVTVTIQDVSGQGGTYSLRVANNRTLEREGISASLSQTSVSVPANGTVTFTVNATIDGNIIRDTSENLHMQFYVVAEQAGGGQSLRMPFYLKPRPTVPATLTGTETKEFAGTMPASDTGFELVEGVTFIDYHVDLDASVLRVEADLLFEEILDDNVADLDLYLLDPDGNEVTSSANPGGPEHLTATITRAGRYTYRVVGWANGPTDFTLRSVHSLGGAPPTLASIPGDFTDAQNRAVDFDGNITLQWQPRGGEHGFEIERSTDGTNFTVVATTDGNTYSATLADQPNGSLTYRVRALTPGQIGFFVTAPSNTASVLVDRRGLVDITSQVRTAMSNVSFTGGIFRLDLTMTNQSTSVYVPHVDLNIVRVTSASGTVRVANADNGGDGLTTPALFSYSNLLGSDQEFAPGEVTGARNLQFRDDAAEMFTFDVVVTAYQRGSSPAGAAGGGSAGTSGSGDGSGTSAESPLQSVSRVLRFTVNPLTRSVTSQLL